MLIAALCLGHIAMFALGIAAPWRDPPQRHTNGRLPLPFRMLLSASLVLAALLVWQNSASTRAPYSGCVLVGMLASFAGDLIMARLIAVPNRLIGGMVAFGSAHALYVAAYVRTIHQHGAALGNPGLWSGLAAYGLATIAGWWWCIRNPDGDALTNAGALLYGAWIGVMASCALALAVSAGGGWWLAALGGASFVASDFIIGATDIGGRQLQNANDWVWLTYVAGQMGIIYAGWLA